MDERIQKLEKLLSDETKQEAVFSGTLEDVKNKLSAEGIEFSEEELTDLAKGMAETQNMTAELDENMLENVSGGSYKSDCYNAGKQIGKCFKTAVKWAIWLFT